MTQIESNLEGILIPLPQILISALFSETYAFFSPPCSAERALPALPLLAANDAVHARTHTRRDVINLEMILWAISGHIHEECLYASNPNSGTFPHLALKTVFTCMSQGLWPVKVSLTCFTML